MFYRIFLINLTRLKSKSNVREKRGAGDGGFSNSLRRRMSIKKKKKIDRNSLYISLSLSILVHPRVVLTEKKEIIFLTKSPSNE
jgi:hypothetical protein